MHQRRTLRFVSVRADKLVVERSIGVMPCSNGRKNFGDVCRCVVRFPGHWIEYHARVAEHSDAHSFGISENPPAPTGKTGQRHGYSLVIRA